MRQKKRFAPPWTSLLFLLCTSLALTPFHAQVVINEYSAANVNTQADGNGEFEDWIELYNLGSNTVDLTGFFLSDKASNPQKWEFPVVSIAAGGHLTIFCSGRNGMSAGDPHTSFKLTQTKNENIIFADPSGTIVDSLTIRPNLTDHSRGRTTDGASTWSVFTSPTPGTSNTGSMQEYSATPTFDMPAGGYNGGVSISLSTTDPTATIRYTTDGSVPTAASTAYGGPISVATTTVVRARGFSSDPTIPTSFVETNTYFVDVSHTVKVVSICGDEIKDFLNDIPFNAFTDNFPGAFEYFDPTLQQLDEGQGEYNKHGNDSWAYDQRGFDFIMRDQFGYNYAVQDEIFPTKNRDEFQRLIIKAAANDNYPFETGAHIRDAFVHHLSQISGLRMDERSYMPCVLYVDGEYWGLYELREKVDDDDFTDDYYDQKELYPDSPEYVQFLKTWGNTWTDYGGAQAQTDWDNFVNFVVNNDMTIQANWDQVDAQYNWKSLVDYIVLNSVIVSKDWLDWNTAWWRGLDLNGDKKKWRYVLWDMDASFGHYINYTGIPDESPNADPCNPEALPDPGGQGHIPVLNKLMTNSTFEQYYKSRYIDLNNTVFHCDNMIAVLDSMIAVIQPEMPAQIQRWGGTVTGWETQVQNLKDFIEDRCAAIDQGLIDCYNLQGPFELTFDVDPPGAGQVKVNSQWLPYYIFTGDYFGGIDILLKAEANPGYVFDYWESTNHTVNPDQDSTDVDLQITGTDNIIAHFRTSDIPVDGFTGFHIASAFSPNGDGWNDFFAPFVGYDVYSFELSVFDRWGEQVFHTTNKEDQWDGTYRGKQLNTGVLVYQATITFTDGRIEKRSGNITLVR